MIEIGVVSRTHGLKGAFMVRTPSGKVSSLATLQEICIEGEWIAIESASWMPKGWLVKLVGIDTIEDAETLVGEDLFADVVDLPTPLPGQYYIHDLVGCAVFEESGEKVGSFKGIEQTNESPDRGQVWWIVETEKGERLVPTHPHFIRSVDVEKKEICLKHWKDLNSIS